MDHRTAAPKPRRGHWPRWAAIALASVAAAVAGWWVLGGPEALQTRTVRDLISADQRVQPVEATQALCVDLGCVEGWHTSHGNYLRFDSQGQAEHWAVVLGDQGRRWKTIVLDLRGVDLTFEDRRYAIDLLFSAHSW